MVKKILAIVTLCVSLLFLCSCIPPADTEVLEAVATASAEHGASGHGDAAAEAFVYWDEDGEVEADCAKCHSTPGYLNHVAGNEAVNTPTGTTVECLACHNDNAMALTAVTFPSGDEITGLGYEAMCMQCHSGRASGLSVDETITESGITDDDTVMPDAGFTNIHYFAAAATLYGSDSNAGYEYGEDMNGTHAHAAIENKCYGCHDQHSLELVETGCTECHASVPDTSATISALADELYEAIQTNAAANSTAIVYSAANYPYFFKDTNANGDVDDGEAIYPNQYKGAWTPSLLKAAYNYQLVLKDPGGYAHNSKYIKELIAASIADLL